MWLNHNEKLPCWYSRRVLYSNGLFFFLVFFCCQHFNISETLCTIMLILGHNNKCVNEHFWLDQFGIKGHIGVTGSKVHLKKKCYFSCRLHYMVMGLMHVYQFDNLCKIYGSRNSSSVGLWSQVSKGHFHQKCYFSFILHVMIMWLTMFNQLYLLCKSYGSERNHLGSQGSKGYFHQKCYNSCMLNSIDQLETLYLCYGLNVNLGSFGVTGVKRSFSTKIL